MAKVLITGANRGIGLELVGQFCARNDQVIAACRQTSKELGQMGVRVIEGVDVADDDSVQSLAAALAGEPLDILFNNAGILTREGLDDLDLAAVRRQFEVNTLGPLRVTRALLPNLSSGAKVAIVTSLMGSLDDDGSGGYYGYRISKAAVNMVGVNLAQDLRSKGIAVFLLHPGMVATEMTGGRGISTEESVRGLLARLDALGLEDSGSFWHSDGRQLAW